MKDLVAALRQIARGLEGRSLLWELRQDQRWLIARVVELTEAVRQLRPAPPITIHVTEVQLKPQGDQVMPPVDRMPDMQLPSASVRAKLSVFNPRKADGSRIDAPTWSTSDETALPLQAIADSTQKDEAGNDILDPVDNQPLAVYSTFANTPLDSGEGEVTFKAAGVADCVIKIKYSDPPLGHVAIVGVEAAEE